MWLSIVRVLGGVVAPNNFEDFFAADDLSGFGNQEPQELAFPFGDALGFTCVGHNFERIKIDGAAVVKRERLEHLWPRYFGSEVAVEPQDELLKVKGFSKVIIASCLRPSTRSSPSFLAVKNE